MEHKITSQGHHKSLLLPASEDTSGDEDDTRLVIDEEDPEYGCMEDLPHLTLPSAHSSPLLSCGPPLDLDKTQQPQIKTEVCWNPVSEEESCLIEEEPLIEKEENVFTAPEPVPDPVEKEGNVSSEGNGDPSQTSFTCPSCPKKFIRKVNLVAHMRAHKSALKYNCEQCGESFDKKRLYSFHVYCHNNQTYECFECGRKFMCKRNLVQHQRDHEKRSSQTDMDEINPSKIDIASFPASSGYWSLKCKKCGKVSSNQHEYDKHLNMQCEDMTGLDSGVDDKFSCKDELEFHLATLRKESQIKTDQCGKATGNSQNTENSLSPGSKTVFCEICDDTFCTKEQLKTHMFLHDIPKYSCPTCKKACRSKKALAIHLLCHTSGSLTQDQQLCKTEKADPASDEFCKTEKVDAGVAELNIRKENDKKSELPQQIKKINNVFVCHKCGEEYKSKETLMEHIALHLQCRKCKKIFNNQRALDLHLVFLGDKKLMSCCICGNLLHGKKELERHLSDHVTAEYKSNKNSSEWEEKTKKIQNIIVGLREDSEVFPAREANVKINKVTPAGKNAVRCAECRKIVRLRHSLEDHIPPSTDKAEADEEFVYISRLGNHNRKRNMTDSYCNCSNSAESILVTATETLQRSKILGKHRKLDICKQESVFKKAKHSHTAIDKCYSASQGAGRPELGVVDLKSLLQRKRQRDGKEYSSTFESDVMIKIGREVGPDSFKSRVDVLPNVKQTGPNTKQLLDQTTIKKEVVPPSEVIIKEEWDIDLCAS